MELDRAKNVVNYVGTNGLPKSYDERLELIKIAYGDTFQNKPISTISEGQAYAILTHLPKTARNVLKKAEETGNGLEEKVEPKPTQANFPFAILQTGKR